MSTKDRIASIRASNPTATASAIAAEVGVSRQRVYQILRKLGLPTAVHEPISYSAEYKAWWNMRNRCTNPACVDFKHYGGRGISVHEAWKNDFSAFLSDVGERPSVRHSLDRINVNGNYEPGNVRWATTRQQRENSQHGAKRTEPHIAAKFWHSNRNRRLSNAEKLRAPQMHGWSEPTCYRRFGPPGDPKPGCFEKTTE